MKLKRLIALAIAVSMLVGILAGCGAGSSSKTGGILQLNNTEEPGSLHPSIAQGTHESWILENIMEGLYTKDASGKLIPGIAKESKVSDDGLVYTFKLRDSVWSNGDPVTAQDFEFSWKYCLNPKTPSNYSYQLYYIKGAEELNTAKDATADKIKSLEKNLGIKCIDEKTLEVTLKTPTPYFLDLTSFYTYLPVPKKVQTANPKWDTEASTYVSNGPFKMAEWSHKQNIKILKNENYWDKDKIKLDGVNFAMIADENTSWQMYKSNKLDLCYPLPQEITGKLRADKDKELKIAADFSTYFYRFNTTKKPFNNVKVRQALAMSIKRTDIVEKVAKGGQLPAFSYVCPGILDGNKDYQKVGGNLFKEDLEKAKQLLSEGLKEEGMSALTFTITYNTNEGHKKIAEAIQDMWKKNLGVDVKLENVEFQVKLDREDKLDFEVTRSGWVGDYVDPMTFMDMFISNSTQNDTGWKNAEYDKLIKEAQNTGDQKVRMSNMHAAEKILMEEMPFMPVYFYTKPYTVKSNVKGVFDIVNRYPQFKYASIN